MGVDLAADQPVRVLIDTNVALDLLLRREPWVSEAAPLLDAHAQGRVVGYIPASALTDIFYIGRRFAGAEKAFQAIDLCLAAFEIISVDLAILQMARTLPGDDFEDNVQIACAMHERLDFIITRDRDGFVDAPIPSLAPKAFPASGK